MASLRFREQSIEIAIRGYSHPSLARDGGSITDAYEANYLLVRIVATSGSEEWIMDGPFMTTFEVLRLANWLDKAAAGQQDRFGFSGIDYYPDFHVSEDHQSLEVDVQQWILGEPGDDIRWGELRFPLDAGVMRQFADDLRREVEPFPVRVVSNDPATAGFGTMPPE